MKLEFLRDMPIITHKLEIDVGLNGKLRFYQDFNCRFTDEMILYTLWTYIIPLFLGV